MILEPLIMLCASDSCSVSVGALAFQVNKVWSF